MAKEWKALLEDIDDQTIRDALRKRLGSFMYCGKTVRVRACSGCSSPREGSGTFRRTRTCKTKACPICARIRSEGVDEFSLEAFKLLNENLPAGYRWHYLTVTTKYDPFDDADATVDALRARADACARACASAWKFLGKHPGAGMLRTIEPGAKGMIHLNLVYLGPPVSVDDLEKVTQKDNPMVGHSHVEVIKKPKRKRRKADEKEAKRNKYLPPEDEAKDESDEGILEGLRAVARYVSKGIPHSEGVNDEDFWTGIVAARTADPKLAARWEIATYKMHLSQKYGSFRGIELDEEGTKVEPELEDDKKVECRCCGLVGQWEWRNRRLIPWLDKCHIRGAKGVHATPNGWRSRVLEPPW